VHAQHYTRITARQEVGNKALACQVLPGIGSFAWWPRGVSHEMGMRIRGLRLMSLRQTTRVLHPASLWRRGSCGRVDDSARSLLPEPACSELGYRWFDQPLEVGVADAHGVGMGARPEYYRFIFR
jgi:hypothetical protein